MMSAAPAAAAATPQVLRDRLLQSLDGQSNIRNMIVVLEVISLLENYPITKKALEETRLGKLINDLRKKTKNENLARRAKKILRNWQKLIEPDSDEMISGSDKGTSWSLSTEGSPSMALSATSCQSDFGNNKELNHFLPPNQDRSGNQVDQKGGGFPVKKDQINPNDRKQMWTDALERFNNSIGLSQKCHHSYKDSSDTTNKRHHKIFMNYFQPQPIVRRHSRSLSGSALYKAPVLQQQARQEQVASAEHCRARSLLPTPHTPTQEGNIKQAAPAQHQSISSTKMRAWSVGNLEPSPQPSGYRVKNFARSWSVDMGSQRGNTLSSSVNNDHRQGRENVGKIVGHKHRPGGNCTLAEHHDTKPLHFTDKMIEHEPETRRKSLLLHLESPPEKEIKLQPQGLKQTNPTASPQQTDRKRLARGEIIQSYLSQQSNLPTSPYVHPHNESFFTTDFFKKEVKHSQDTNIKHMLATQVPVKDLPGITREITKEDLRRLNTQRWPGVNGCYDTKGIWYDWTQSVPLDLNGDGKKLNILPYVCLDLM